MKEDKNIKSRYHEEVINKIRFEVTSNYLGKVSLLDLIKEMIKRDLEKLDEQ